MPSWLCKTGHFALTCLDTLLHASIWSVAMCVQQVQITYTTPCSMNLLPQIATQTDAKCPCLWHLFLSCRSFGGMESRGKPAACGIQAHGLVGLGSCGEGEVDNIYLQKGQSPLGTHKFVYPCLEPWNWESAWSLVNEKGSHLCNGLWCLSSMYVYVYVHVYVYVYVCVYVYVYVYVCVCVVVSVGVYVCERGIVCVWMYVWLSVFMSVLGGGMLKPCLIQIVYNQPSCAHFHLIFAHLIRFLRVWVEGENLRVELALSERQS